ncbi:MAG: methylmalonyl-CoA mutase [Alphaproteobacteria bacterium]|nr:methylmalonyl-CoA mutase [Alphaproteobacteria bacterium]
MNTPLTALAADFPEVDEARWRALAEKALAGAPWDRLVKRTADDLRIQPVYRETDIAAAGEPFGAPGQAPFARGRTATRDAFLPWHIRQAVAHADPAGANAEILDELRGGASSIELVVDPTGASGVALLETRDVARALDGLLVDLAPVSLDAGAYGLRAAELVADYLRDAGQAAAPPAFNVDPIGALMTTGRIGADDLAAAVAFARAWPDTFPGAAMLRADARPVHEAGGSEAQEIAAALATGVAYLRALTAAGAALDEANAAISFTLAVGPDVLVEAAKLRALRLAWARVMEAAGAAPADRAARVVATTSRRMMTRRDPWSNILRTTAAAFAAAVGGAEAITVRPLTDALGPPSPFARRIARNTQIILMEESRLGHVVDPAGGAWFVEAMTRDLAEAAWKEFQGIEAQGGIIEALLGGALQSEIEIVRTRREKAIATRRETITGVTDFPLLDERAPPLAPAVAPARRGEAPAPRGAVTTAKALAPIRWAAPFEALRDVADAQAKRPAVFFANLGPLAEFSARSNFAQNLFAAGGVAAFGADTPYADHAALAAAFKASGLTVAVLTGSDTRYAAESLEAATALKAAGCTWLIHAGKPADEAAVRAKGFDQFIFAGQDALDALTTLHAALGVKA